MERFARIFGSFMLHVFDDDLSAAWFTVPMLYAFFEFMVQNTFRLAFGRRIRFTRWKM